MQYMLRNTLIFTKNLILALEPGILRLAITDQWSTCLTSPMQPIDLSLSLWLVICASEHKKTVDDYLGRNDDPFVGYNQAKTWALKKRLAPKNTLDHPAAKKDSNGTLVTDKSQLEKLYEKTYEERLTPNPTCKGLEEVQQLQNYLFELRCELAKNSVTQEWSEEKLDAVLKSLKK